METNQLLINYYKKEELKKVKERFRQGLTIDEISNLANKEYISTQEIKQTLGIDDNEIEEDKKETEHIIDEQDIIIEDEEQNAENSQIVMITQEQLEDYPNQPFKQYDEEKRNEMIESIKAFGIMQPLIVRPINNNKYQILSGHNRRNCAKEIGIKKLPCIIKNNLTDSEAKIYLIDTNLCTREKLSPMEKARAYRIKNEMYSKSNKFSRISREVQKDILTSTERIKQEENISAAAIQRYLRLTYLIPKLQEIIDNEKAGMKVGEQISFLTNSEQKIVADIIENGKKISFSISKKIREESNKKKEKLNDTLNKEEIMEIIDNRKNKDTISIEFSIKEINNFFDGIQEKEELKKYILDLAEKYYGL